MLSDQELQFHRSFLSLNLSLKIWNEDYNHQNSPGGRPPDRQKKIESDPVYAYHVRQGPHWPSKPPGEKPDSKYNALLARDDGSFEPLVIITKRGMTGQNFLSTATTWEYTNSVMCPFGGRFRPVVNWMMEVTGHYSNVVGDGNSHDDSRSYLLHPKGISFSTPSEYISNRVPLFLWKEFNAPEGWEKFQGFNGGIDVVVLPDGEVVGANGHQFSSNNGTTYSVISPLDFWAPGSRVVAAGIRGLTTRISAVAVKGFRALRIPTKKLAESTVALLSRNTSTGMAVSTGTLPFHQAGRRTIIMGEDMAPMKAAYAVIRTPPKTYDVIIHGDDAGFYVLVKRIPHPDPKKVKEIYRKASVREVANLVRPHLAPGDEIRLLACTTGNPKGPAQQLASELENTRFGHRTSQSPTNTVFSRRKTAQ